MTEVFVILNCTLVRENLKEYILNMGRSKRDGSFVEFVVHDNLQGRELTESLRRKGVQLERPYEGNKDIDLNGNLVVAKVPSRMLGVVTRRVSGHSGLDILVGVYSLLPSPRS